MAAADPALQRDLFCPECRYNLRGVPDGECPECGTGFTRKQLVAIQKRRPYSPRDILTDVFEWTILYWITFAPFFVIVTMLIAMVIEDRYNLGPRSVAIGAILCFVITLLLTWAVAAQLGRKLEFNHRIKKPHRPPPRIWMLTAICFLFLMVVLIAAPFVVFGLVFLILG